MNNFGISKKCLQHKMSPTMTPRLGNKGEKGDNKSNTDSESENSESSSEEEEVKSDKQMLIDFKDRWDEDFFLDNTYELNCSDSS